MTYFFCPWSLFFVCDFGAKGIFFKYIGLFHMFFYKLIYLFFCDKFFFLVMTAANLVTADLWKSNLLSFILSF